MKILDPSVETFLHSVVPPPDAVRARMEAYGAEQRFPLIGPLVGSLCYQLALAIGARTVFEMGSGWGYSAWWFARAIGPQGKVYCTDKDPANRDRAKEYLEEAGLWDRVRFEVGEATTTLARQRGPFDLVFVDVDKEGYPQAFEVAANRVRAGGLIVADNALWGGRVIEGHDDGSAATAGVVEYLKRARAHPSLATIVLPVRDGVAVSIRLPGTAIEESPWRSIESS